MNRSVFAKWMLAIEVILVMLLSSGCEVVVIETEAAVPTQAAASAQSTRPAQAPAPTAEEQQGGAMFYNLPDTALNHASGLFASPNRAEKVAPVDIPAGTTVYVMGRNATSSHLRVVWNGSVGWMPTSYTGYNGNTAAMKKLAVFQREPPNCAVPLTNQYNLNSRWKFPGPGKAQVAVVIDLFRSSYGDFPASSLGLTVNGKPVESSRRQIVERGQFSLKDVVFTLPDYLQPGDELGYALRTDSKEPLVFLATIFNVPDRCVWKTN